MSASLTQICPSNYLRSNYQTHRFYKIQITNFLPINFKNMFLKKNCLYIYREKKNIGKKIQLKSWFRLQTRS